MSASVTTTHSEIRDLIASVIYVSRRVAAFDFVVVGEISRLELDELESALSVEVIQVPPLNSPESVFA